MSSEVIYTSPLCSCILCGVTKSAKGIHSHYRIAHTEAGKNSHLEISKNANVIRAAQTSKKYKDLSEANLISYQSNPKFCVQCKGQIPFKKRHNLFCSRSCCASHSNAGANRSDRTKEKISNGVKKYMSENTRSYTKIEFCTCKQCGAKFVRIRAAGVSKTWCSKQCGVLGRSFQARNNPGLGTNRSKHEIELYNICEAYFHKTTNNEKLFNGWDADILIYDHKIAVLWNGPWHYREMGLSNHSLKQVQNRDKIKTKEIIDTGWIPIVYEDRYYTPKLAFLDILKRIEVDRLEPDVFSV